jgi:hypothetical protein
MGCKNTKGQARHIIFQARTAEQRWRSGRRETRDTLAIPIAAPLRESFIEQEHKPIRIQPSDGRRGGCIGVRVVACHARPRLLITCYSMLYGSQRKLLELPRRSFLPQLAASCLLLLPGPRLALSLGRAFKRRRPGAGGRDRSPYRCARWQQRPRLSSSRQARPPPQSPRNPKPLHFSTVDQW